MTDYLPTCTCLHKYWMAPNIYNLVVSQVGALEQLLILCFIRSNAFFTTSSLQIEAFLGIRLTKCWPKYMAGIWQLYWFNTKLLSSIFWQVIYSYWVQGIFLVDSLLLIVFRIAIFCVCFDRFTVVWKDNLGYKLS